MKLSSPQNEEIAFLACSETTIAEKLLDAAGALIYGHYSRKYINVCFNEDEATMKLFDFRHFHFSSSAKQQNVQLKSFEPTRSLSPYLLLQFLECNNNDNGEDEDEDKLSLKSVSRLYGNVAMYYFRPAEWLRRRYIPHHLKRAYGIHLAEHKHTEQHHELIKRLLCDLEKIIIRDDDPKFFVCGGGSDSGWPKYFETLLQRISDSHQKSIQFIHVTREFDENFEKSQNFQCVLEMFCLARCKQIFVGGAPFDAFALLAALMSNKSLVMGYDFDVVELQLWCSAVNINGRKITAEPTSSIFAAIAETAQEVKGPEIRYLIPFPR